MGKRNATDLDLTLARHPLYDEVEPEEVDEVDGQLQEFLKNIIAVTLLFQLIYRVTKQLVQNLPMTLI